MRHLIEPSGACVPCHKEIICSEKASALIRTGHQLMLAGAWTAEGLDGWNRLLDHFIAEAGAALEAGPLAAPGSTSRASAAAGAEDWPAWFARSVEHFAAFAEGLPAGERDAALKAGRDALDQVAAGLAPAPTAERWFEGVPGASPDGGG